MQHKKVYICHPFRGLAANFEAITQICRTLAESNPGIIPVSPVHTFSYLNDSKHRELALEYCLALLETCDEVWVYGDWRSSEGCCKEVEHARELGMPVIEMSK